MGVARKRLAMFGVIARLGSMSDLARPIRGGRFTATDAGSNANAPSSGSAGMAP